MSDPVTNAEIEDVLTSIRRLVSENRKAVTSVAPASGAPAERGAENSAPAGEPAASSALVLTPALRVAEEEAPAADDVLADDQTFDLETEEVEDPFAGPGAVEAGPSVVDWDDAARDSEDSDPFEEPENNGDEPDSAVNAAADVELEETAGWNQPDQLQSFADADADGEGDAVELAFAVEEGEHEAPEAVESEIDPDQIEAADAEAEAYEGGVPDESDMSRAGPDYADDRPSGEEVPFDFQQVLESRISRWRDGEPETGLEDPDAPGDSDYAGTVEADKVWDVGPVDLVDDSALDALEAELEEEFVEEVHAAVMPELADAVDEAAVVDEEILREMVADIVRQELQGALGERITRNVRKLVRREIHRALAAHDLD